MALTGDLRLLYEKLGFERAQDLDFMQGALRVFGFSLGLDPATG